MEEGQNISYQKRGMEKTTISAKNTAAKSTAHMICPPIVDLPASGGKLDKRETG